METEKYFKDLKKNVDKVYLMANKARAKGLDPKTEVEIPLAMSMAEKVVSLISTIYPQMQESGIAKRILDLEKEFGKLDSSIVFKIADEVAHQKFCKFENTLQGIDAGIRIGFAYITLGVVSSPIEGYTGIKTRLTRDGKEYLEASFSGPIRSAGTTASVICLMLIDYLREVFGYAKYDPTEDEIKRVWAELEHFHDRITNLQGMPTEREALYLAERMNIQVAGDPSEKIEVPNYKNLERVDTDFLRSGFCLVMAEALAQKAKKGFRLYNHAKENGVKMSGFDWLDGYIELQGEINKGKGKKVEEVPPYIRDLVAGRPVFGHPSSPGSLRLRYGRGRNSGFSASAVHPATMAVSDGFIAIGTQLKIEKPTKGCVVTSCDSIDGPIVKLKNGSVRKLHTAEEGKKLYKDVEEIIYFGDFLFPFSDFLNRNADLIKPGYVEEWWKLDLRKASKGNEHINPYDVSFEKAVELSEKYKIPLHPEFIYYWNQVSRKEFESLLEWLRYSWVDGKIIFPYNKTEQEKFAEGKRTLELLGIEHEVTIENVVLDKDASKALLLNVGLDWKIVDKEEKVLLQDFIDCLGFSDNEDVLDMVNSVCKFKIKDKAGDFIGTRMGRPEKGKLRKLTGSPNVLFPIGSEGGRLRSVQAACEVGKVRSTFPLLYCKKCHKETIYSSCEVCNEKTTQMYYFYETKEKSFNKEEKHLEKQGTPYQTINLDIVHYYQKALSKLKMEKEDAPDLIKGVRGTTSGNRVMEHLAKGFLRAKYDLQVNKDGTIRFDATELPLVHFKPKEVYVSVEKLIEIGYDKDIFGNVLEEEDQILELMPHDILLPACPDSPDEKADDVFVKITKFVDEELEKFYGLKKFYNVKNREDLIGKLGVCMAPHNCAGVVCRFIGFSDSQGLVASPYMHAAIRRDCFDFDTYIPIKREGFWKNVKIGELVEELNPERVIDGFGTKEKKVKGFETISFDKNLKESKINNFTKHPKRKMFEIKTSLGKSLRVTENHKFLIEGKEKRMSSLKVGDKLPLPRRIDILSKDLKEINLIDFLKDEELMVRKINSILEEEDFKKGMNHLGISKKQFMNFKLRDSYPLNFVLGLDKKTQNKIFKIGKLARKRDNVEVPIKIKLSNELLEVIGLYVAEGYSRSINSKKGLNQVYISSFDKKIRGFIEKTIKDSFGLVKTENKEDRVTFSSRVLYLFFTKILEAGSIAQDKRIPSLFLGLPLERLACCLRGYFEGDGSVSSSDSRVTCDSVSDGLLNDLEFCLARFGIFTKRYGYEKEPGPKVKSFYLKKKRIVPKFKIIKLIIGSSFIEGYKKIGFLSDRKNKIFEGLFDKNPYGMRIDFDKDFVYDSIVSINYLGEKESYCLNVNTKSHLIIANSIVSKQCDGDEASIMLLGDVLLNFSREFLPSHRGGTQDAPLVLNARIDAGEVDDQILDLEMCCEYPLELYQLAEQRKHSSEVKSVPLVKDALNRGEDPFRGIGFTHDTKNINDGVLCSSYKLLGTMQEKVKHQMELVERIRAVDTSDTARLVIERHFMRDLKGNLRKFSQQDFRCVGCNYIMRRPPLNGVCPMCKGKIIFTIHEGGIKKYLEPALDLAKKYNLSPYLQQSLTLVKGYIDSIFGKELEKQTGLKDYF